MPPDERQLAESLDRALDALGAGASFDEVAGALPAGEREALAAAADLATLAEHHDGPSPAFVLGLEEHLRTDFRLGVGRTARRVVPGARALVLLLLFGLTLAVATSPPAGGLSTARRAWESLRVRVGGAFVADDERADHYFDEGRRRLDALGGILAREEHSGDDVTALLDELVQLYQRGVATAAARVGDEVRARAELEAAGLELARLERMAPPGDAALLRATHDELRLLMAPATPAPAATPSRVALGAPTDAPTAAVATAPAATPTPHAVATELPSPVAPPTLAPPPTQVPPTAERPRPEPSATSLPTMQPGEPIVPATPTADRWPTATPGAEPGTPGPPPTGAPTAADRPPVRPTDVPPGPG